MAALDDFDGIVKYIAQDNPAAAVNVADAIDRAIESLIAMPTGHKGRVAGTYEKTVRRLPYIIAYALGGERKGHEIITVLRIIHGARNWPEESWPE